MSTVSAEPRPCSIARTLDIVGEKWALLAIREVFLGTDVTAALAGSTLEIPAGDDERGEP